MPSWLIRVRTLFRRARMERELDAELAFHLEMQAAEYVRRGMSPERARRSDVASMVVGEGVRLAVKGLALGAVGAMLRAASVDPMQAPWTT